MSTNINSITVSVPQLGMNGKIFTDAMKVRNAVFVVEQGVPAENELDHEESRCWHWVVYQGTTPVGAVRLVAPPHLDADGPDKELEGNFLKLGRLAVDKSVRGKGIGKILVDTVIAFATKNPDLVGPRDMEGNRIEGHWDGRMLAHAQTKVRKVSLLFLSSNIDCESFSSYKDQFPRSLTHA
jgi:predicted GNAT family N-acyltransferase